MPIISTIGRKQLRTRLITWSIFTVLSLGAVTMVYPFLLMLSGSTKSAVDTPDALVIPRYLIDDNALYQKHAEGLFNELPSTLQNSYGLWNATFNRLEPPAKLSPLTEEWKAFRNGISTSHSGTPAPGSGFSTWFVLGYLQCPLSRAVVPYNLGKFRGELLKEEGSITAINLKYGTRFASASSFVLVPPNYLNRFVNYPDTEFLRRVEEFGLAQPQKWKCYVSLANSYRSFLQNEYGRDIKSYNKAKGTTFASWNEVPAGERVDDYGAWARQDFGEFVRGIVNPVFLKLEESASSAYREYLKDKYSGDLSVLNIRYEAAYNRFDDIPLPATIPASGLAKSDWKGFIEGWQDPETGKLALAPLESVQLTGPDFSFRNYLKEKYGSLETMNRRLGTNYASWEVVPMPQQEAQYEEFQEMKGWLRWQFTIRNYVDVWNYLVINGRGLVNTIIFCALSVLAALTVDPIAAYALSRFKPRSTYKVLLFLMMTMAFPTMVTQIPTFLLLRDLGMLNTFWALVLPGIANGYHIFLLKGFFDSLPRELYESAEIDGASEFTIFMNITMSLSKPILAVIALGAFTSAYAAFMFALLLCQDPKMWTLMVWLYQLQQSSGQGIVFASLIIAAIPMLAVFLACQNLIMRGIVVPVEK